MTRIALDDPRFHFNRHIQWLEPILVYNHHGVMPNPAVSTDEDTAQDYSNAAV